jgi:hypothetical protein
MKGLTFLSLVGAAIYALLVDTNDAIKDGNAEITYAGQAQSNHTVGEHFSSWDAYLPTPAVSPNSQSANSQDQASVSSPTVRFYSPGTNLHVIKREGSWFLVSDPITQEQGWVLDEYLSSSGATSSQAALASTTEPPSTKAASPKSKKLSQSSKRSKPAVRVSNPRSAKPAFRSREWDPWNIPWARRVDRRRGFEPFLLGRFAQGR